MAGGCGLTVPQVAGQCQAVDRPVASCGALSDEQVGQILTVAGLDEAMLRQLLVESRPLPVALRDTLQRFAVQAENEAFLLRPVKGRSTPSA